MAAHFDPLSDFEDFDLRLRVTRVELKRLNDFASAYGKFDFNAGTGDLVLEAQAKRGQLDGYISRCCATWTCSTGGRTWRMATRTCSARCGRRWSAGRDGAEEPAQRPVRNPCEPER